MRLVIKNGDYELRLWKSGDFATLGMPPPATFSLYLGDEQVGAAYMIAKNVLLDFVTRPRFKGHGTVLMEFLLSLAKKQGFESFKVESVTGHGNSPEEILKNREAMEHLLKKFNFQQKDSFWIRQI
jgi:GNAT superfamily N-acetyltransferase